MCGMSALFTQCPHLVYLILVERYFSRCYFLSHLHQVFLDVLNNDVTILVGQDLPDDIAAKSQGQQKRGVLHMYDLRKPLQCLTFIPM